MVDRRSHTNAMIDVSKVIWIMATNALDDDVRRFYESNKPITTQTMLQNGAKLQVQLRKRLFVILSVSIIPELRKTSDVKPFPFRILSN